LKISIIIPTLGRKKALSQCLNALNQQLVLPFEVIVVLNNKNNPQIIQEKYSFPISWIDAQKQKGQSRAKNIGAQNARGDLLAFIDDDCKVKNDFIEKIKSFYKSQENWQKIILVGNIIFTHHYPKSFSPKQYKQNILKDRILNLPLLILESFFKKSAGGTIFPWGRCVIQYNTKIPQYGQNAKPIACDWGGAGNLMIPRKLFLHSSGFDNHLMHGCHFEEPELCLRLKNLGAQIYFSAKVIVDHPEISTQAQNFYHLRANEMYFGLKNCAFHSPISFVLFCIYHIWQTFIYILLSFWKIEYFKRIQGKIKGVRHFLIINFFGKARQGNKK